MVDRRASSRPAKRQRGHFSPESSPLDTICFSISPPREDPECTQLALLRVSDRRTTSMTEPKWSKDEKPLLPLFDEALRLRDIGEVDAAINLLDEIVSRVPGRDSRLLSHSHIQLGHIYRNVIRDPKKAEPHFRAAVACAPTLELASMNLFHTLHALGRPKEAMREIIRLLSLTDSEGYRELLAEGFEDELPTAERMMAAHARALLERHRGNTS